MNASQSRGHAENESHNPASFTLGVDLHVRDIPAFIAVVNAAIAVIEAAEQDGVVYTGDERLAKLRRTIELLSPELGEGSD